MNLFDYVQPSSIAEAVAAGSEPGARFLAGGTNLLDLMKAGVSHPGRIVDITRLPGLDTIERLEDGTIRIGALVRNSDLARDPLLTATAPAVAEALLSGASPQLRNAATVGGNLLQETRCPYFYDPMSVCNRRDPGAGCDAIGGETQGHAVLGWTDSCIATHPSDFCVPLAALGATVEIEGPQGTRQLHLVELHQMPENTALAPGELITALLLPADTGAFAAHARYLKVRERTSYAFALVSAVAMLRIEDGTITAARLALGGVAPKPWRVPEAEALLEGQAVGRDAFAGAADVLLAGARPSGDNAFKIELAKRTVLRALTLAAAGTPDRTPALPASVFASANGALAHA